MASEKVELIQRLTELTDLGEKIRKLPCKHIFHDTCIMPWLDKNITCPNCRFNLMEYFTENPEDEQY